MPYGRYGWSHRFLRWGLAAVFIYIGYSIFDQPQDWIGYIPESLPGNITRENALQFNGAFDIVLGLLFIAGTLPRLTALAAVGHLVAILATQGIDAVLIRDVGLLGTSLALLVWPHRRHRRRWLPRFWKRRSQVEQEM
jgi:uncharacterized membrane protein YphA (DoxX/SURF4 family)